MERITMLWGWTPPKYEIRNERLLLFYSVEKRAVEISGKDPDTDEPIVNTVDEWVCSVMEYSEEESKRMLDILRDNPDSIEFVRWMKEECIKAYDSSDHVNSFSIGGVHTWLDKATRVGLKLRFEAEKRMGKTETTLWQNGKQFPLPLVGDVTALDMLDGIELYASSCYDVTQMHLAEVSEIEDVEALKTYDYTSGYPQKLSF